MSLIRRSGVSRVFFLRLGLSMANRMIARALAETQVIDLDTSGRYSVHLDASTRGGVPSMLFALARRLVEVERREERCVRRTVFGRQRKRGIRFAQCREHGRI